MITVNEYFAQNKKVFDYNTINTLVPNLLTELDCNILNEFFLNDFSTCGLGTEVESENFRFSAITIYKKRKYYEGIKEALEKTFDPLNKIDLKTVDTNSGNDTITQTHSSQVQSTETP